MKLALTPHNRQSVEAEQRFLFFFLSQKCVDTKWQQQNCCRDAAFKTNYAKNVTKMIPAMRTCQQAWPA